MNFDFIDNNSLVTRSIKSLKIVNDYFGVSYTIVEYSNPIDISGILKKYDRVPRKITLNQFLSCYIMSNLLRLAIKSLKNTDGDFVLIEQDLLSIHPFMSNKVFWTDNKAFLWSLEYTNKWIFILGCQIKVGYDLSQ